MTSGTLTVITLVAAIVAVASAMIGNARGHDPYTDWKDNKGFDCCHGRDCQPVRADATPEGWRVWFNGRWVPVPADAVLNDRKSHDGRSHVCIAPGAVEPRCFVPGETRS